MQRPVRPLICCEGASCGKDLLADEMQTNYRRPLPFIKMAAHGVTHLHTQIVQIITFREDGLTQCVGGIPTFGSFFDDED